MKATPYLFFYGACAEALAFYREALGAEIRALVRFRDMPGAGADAGDRVMHAEFSVVRARSVPPTGRAATGQGRAMRLRFWRRTMSRPSACSRPSPPMAGSRSR